MSIVKTFEKPPYSYKEILRYSGVSGDESSFSDIIDECISELDDKLKYLVCYEELPIKIEGATISFGDFSLVSKSLSKNLVTCDSVVIFSATIGIEIDRLILKYGKISPTKALFFQSIGAERIEALCDAFCDYIKEQKGRVNKKIKPRFSAGYGDCPLSVQKDIFTLLDCPKKIGLSLTENLMMTPTKSVSAFIGIQ